MGDGAAWRRHEVVALVLAGAPVALLAAAYAWLAVDRGTAALLPVVVHESGRYTLAETVLYWRHALREVPIAALYAAASVAAFRTVGPAPARGPSTRLRAAALASAGLLVVAAWTGTIEGWGAEVAWSEVRQAYLRDAEPPVPGAHWGYHLLSTIGYACGALALAALVRRARDGASAPRRWSSRPWWPFVAIFAALTALCGIGTAPFVDGRHLGHQARELATHALVTLPLSCAVLLVAGGRRHEPRGSGGALPRAVVAALAVGALVLVWLGVGVLVTHAADAAHANASLASLVAAHAFEHALDGTLVVLLALGFAPGTDASSVAARPGT